MSFSSEMKENLSKIANLNQKKLVRYELIGYLMSHNATCHKKTIQYATVNEYNINRFSKLLSNMNLLDFQIELKGKIYRITLPKITTIEEIEYAEKDVMLTSQAKEELTQEEQRIKAFIRGIFLGSGSVNNPENKYHLEMIINTQKNAKIVKELLEKMQIHMKEMERKKGYSLYLKEGEEISKFLAFIGANSAVLKFEEIRVLRDMKNHINRKVNCETANAAVLKFEEIRVLRDMKNHINRKVNCETANLSKTIHASVKQIEAIKNIQKQGKFESLSDSLKEIALLRLENPHASLIELGQMLENPIGKSGVNHRLKQIEQLGEE